MFHIILYFSLNFAGFVIFLYVWNRIPKPKPLDYTTIPGLKLDVSNAEELPDMELAPGCKVDANVKGHIEELRKFKTFRGFLQFLTLHYGPLSSFWWGSRYVVLVSDCKLVSELKNFSSSLISISPFSIGSYLRGDKKYCTMMNYSKLLQEGFDVTDSERFETSDGILNEEVQDKFVFGKYVEAIREKQCNTRRQVSENLYQWKWQYQLNLGEDYKEIMGRPLVVAFDKEIWIDGHPIPKFVPIVIITSEIICNWSDTEILPKFCSYFNWIPGFTHLKLFE